MSNETETPRRTALRPIVLGAAVLVAIAGAAWWTNNPPVSETDPASADNVVPAPTGAGSTPDGVANVINDGVNVQARQDDLIGGSTDAADLTGISDQDASVIPVEEPARSMVEPGEVISPENGQVEPRTGLVEAPDAGTRQASSDDGEAPSNGS
ncbi:hypothetical protein [Salipiger mucosus]|uniref:Uncharacterized protein n=1 Tax=Salipiger mucosus DSM 16094 TaxID=1123237 RepID=S9RZB2_9RHOB|nr:hypothetical protein [Salipiger mucosus]EPX83355.1 hypothetical protein Salmuc_01017 [Salipiger mucosus DSM 16094]